MAHTRRRLIVGLGAMIIATNAGTQQSAKIARVGFLAGGAIETSAPNLHALVAALQSLGWSEGRKLTIEARYAASRGAEIPRLAGELVRLRPNRWRGT